MIPPEQVAAMVADANLLDDGTDVYLADWVRALAAEVTRLTARVAEVTEQAKRAGDRVDATEAENETLRKRITTLSKERDRLRAALTEIMIGKTTDDLAHPLGEWVSMAMRFMNIARAALAGARNRSRGRRATRRRGP